MDALAVASALVFVWAEKRAQEPIIPLELFSDRNFNLATLAGLIIAIAMFGAIAYMPTYFQMAAGVSATEAGLLMIAMVVGLMSTALTTGALVSKTGKYKAFIVSSGVVVAGGLGLLSTINADTSVWVVCVFLFVIGAGIGLGMQNLLLVAQSAFSNTLVGTATATNNFFREIGATLGGAVVGALFTSRLSDRLADNLPAGALEASGAHGSGGLTPDLVHHLPEAIQNVVVNAYADALTPVFLMLVPLALLQVVVLAFVKEKPLAASFEEQEAQAHQIVHAPH